MNTLLSPQKVQEIKKNANELLSRYAHISNPYDLVSAIAADHHIKLLESDLYEMSGALRKEGDAWVIIVNRSDSGPRKLFTIAHELGHFFVHRTICDEFIDGQLISRFDDQKYLLQELEANEFAGNLMMPESKVRELVQGPITADSIQPLARSFGVSTLAIQTRLKNLGYEFASTS